MRNITRAAAVIKLGMVISALAGCGYQPVYAGKRPTTRLTVSAAPHGMPHVEAVQAAISGVRRSLSRAGVLRAGQGYPRVVVELVRVDERAAGVRALQTPAGDRPLARGVLVGVVGRAWVQEAQFSPRSSDTGDVRRNQSYEPASHPTLEQIRHQEAVSAAAHALGEALGRRILHEPETTLEPM